MTAHDLVKITQYFTFLFVLIGFPFILIALAYDLDNHLNTLPYVCTPIAMIAMRFALVWWSHKED